MSNNIDHSRYMDDRTLSINSGVARKLRDKYLETCDLAEDCFLHDLNYDDDACDLVIEDFNWVGEHSGPSYDILEQKILPRTKGQALILFTWEGGEQFAIEVKDGVVKEKKLRLVVEDNDDE